MEAISSKSYEPCCLATSHARSPSVLWDAWLLKLFTSLYKNNIGTAGSSFWNVLHLLHQLNALAFAHIIVNVICAAWWLQPSVLPSEDLHALSKKVFKQMLCLAF